MEWVPDPRPTPEALTEEFHAEPYTPPHTHFATVADQLDHATIAQLMELARGGVGEPDGTV